MMKKLRNGKAKKSDGRTVFGEKQIDERRLTRKGIKNY